MAAASSWDSQRGNPCLPGCQYLVNDIGPMTCAGHRYGQPQVWVRVTILWPTKNPYPQDRSTGILIDSSIHFLNRMLKAWWLAITAWGLHAPSACVYSHYSAVHILLVAWTRKSILPPYPPTMAPCSKTAPAKGKISMKKVTKPTNKKSLAAAPSFTWCHIQTGICWWGRGWHSIPHWQYPWCVIKYNPYWCWHGRNF